MNIFEMKPLKAAKKEACNFIIFLSLLIGFTSCGPDYVYENTLDCQEQGWFSQDSLEIVFDIADSNTIYNLHLILKHSPEFAYQNFYTRIHTTFPDGQRLTEQLSLELAGKGGVWLGNCGRNSCELDIPIQQGVFFNQIGAYRIVVEQFSRQDPLKGIQSMKFALENTGEIR